MKPVAVFRFSDTEGPGHFATFLDANRIPWTLVKLDEGEPGISIVADGRRVPNYRLKLDTVSIGGLTLYNVDATVGEGSVGFGLLGMSFLSRTEMRREGQNLTLTKRY